MTSYVGWLVLHSIWQGTLVAGAAALALGVLPDDRVHARYGVTCAALCAMLALPCATLAAGSGPGALLGARAAYLLDAAVPVDVVSELGPALLATLAAIWISIVSLMIARLTIDGLRARALSRWARPSNPRVRALAADLGARLRIRGTIDVRSSPDVIAPMVAGVARPVILLPLRLEASLTASQLRAVLAHELAHLRRGDHAANLLQVCAEALLAHHPAAWWISRRIRAEREYACDDVALAATGRNVRSYAHALASLDNARAARIAVAASSGTLLDRLQRIAGMPRRQLTPVRGTLLFAAACVCSAALLAVAAAIPPPWLPPGSRLRRPGPPAASMAAPR